MHGLLLLPLLKNPTIALAVLIEHSGTGGSVAAPIAKEILKCYFNK